MAELNDALQPQVPVATVCGRYYAMDRDNRWSRVVTAYNAIVEAEGSHFPDAKSAIADAYSRDIGDEFIPAAVIGSYAGMRDGDGVLCFNFRADRVREILAALLDPAFSAFPRQRAVSVSIAVGMPPYSKE